MCIYIIYNIHVYICNMHAHIFIHMGSTIFHLIVPVFTKDGRKAHSAQQGR